MAKSKSKPPKRRHSAVFITCLVVSVCLTVGGFFVPPMGVIDGSVLTAVGLLLGFAVVSMLPEIINSGTSAKINLPGNTTVELNK